MARRPPPEADDGPGHLRRSTTWHGVRAGDRVEIAGVRARGTTWTFLAHVVNERNGTESVEVVGGRAGDRTVRSFDPGRVFAVTGQRGRSDRLPLADEPQLPLG